VDAYDNRPVLIREATETDWPAIWPFFRTIVRAGETYAYDPGLDEGAARAIWMLSAPGRTFVAVDDDNAVLGSAKCHPNQAGPGSHVATASFMVDPERGARGVGRALAEFVIDWARTQGYLAMQFNAVVETNTRAVRLWHSVGFEIVGTVPEAFAHPEHGYVGLHVMHRYL
jgi:L-amino acid N-acyltransferase YncA